MLVIKPHYRRVIDERLPKGRYEILHVRLGDSFMQGGSSAGIDSRFKLLYEHLREYINSDVLFITDSLQFKSYLMEVQSDLQFLPGKPVHLGLQADKESILDTLAEFMSMERASRINSYSVYDWDSGFTKAGSLIFDVPLRRIPRIQPFSFSFSNDPANW